MTTDISSAIIFFLLFSVTLLLGCLDPATERARGEHPQERSEPVRARVGQEFDLRIGQQAMIEGEDFSVRFAAVVRDSRCPEDVACVWAGNAEVLIEAEAGGSPAGVKLNTHGGAEYPQEGRHQQYSLRLVALRPHPRTDRAIRARDYAATLLIRKE